MKPSAPRTDLVLVLARTEQHGIAELVGTICYRYTPNIDATAPPRGRRSARRLDSQGFRYAAPGDLLNPHFENADGVYDRYADLCVRASIDTGGITDDRRCWGWRYEYRPLAVDLPRAESMTTMLRRIGRQLDSLDAQFGRPATFADYLTRFATALGITSYAVYSQQLRADGTHWIWLDADGMRSWIAHHEPPVPTPWP
ncbi:hypothetical protein [Dactylosporangium sp. CA-233914]|uniref:hypothetical protein n=1 Tax=Dactylosporangium sp. CA-233914 TaxID=3239934 RepID=UPI003D935467